MRFLYDTFTTTDGTLLTNHAGESGTIWTQHPVQNGQGTIASNRVYLSSNGIIYANVAPPSADYTVTASVHIHTHVGTLGIVGRLSTSAVTYYMFRLTSTAYELYRAVSGSLTLLDSATVSVPTGTTVMMRLSMIGDHIRGYADGALVCEATDSQITAAGRVGFRDPNTASVSATTGRHVDWIAASTPGDATPSAILTPGPHPIPMLTPH